MRLCQSKIIGCQHTHIEKIKLSSAALGEKRLILNQQNKTFMEEIFLEYCSSSGAWKNVSRISSGGFIYKILKKINKKSVKSGKI